MYGEGSSELKQSMGILLNQEVAKKYLLQASSDDKIIVIPFSSHPLAEWRANGNDPGAYSRLLDTISNFAVGGGTDIFTPVIQGLGEIAAIDSGQYSPAVILMTDGDSNYGKTFEDLQQFYDSLGKDIPVFTITFGEAKEEQLQKIVTLTRSNMFDGKSDLVTAFRKAKGYN
jgi:Ca-activated chloride channel family protein